MKKKLLAFFILLSGSLLSQNDIFFLNLKKKCDEIKSLHCKFKQEKKVKGNKIVSTIGEFSFNPKREFEISYTKPKPVKYTYDGKVFRMYENGIEKKASEEIQKRVSGMMGLLSDLIKANFDRSKYTIDIKEIDSEILLVMKAKSKRMQNNTGVVSVVYDRKDYTLNMLELGDVKLSFYDKKTIR